VEGTVILAFDVSGSMAATDFKPTRMDAASHCLGRAFRLPFCSFARHGLMSGCIQSFPPKKAAARKNSGG